MRNLYNSGRRDGNEDEIKDYLREKSIPFIALVPGQGADLIVLLHDFSVFVENKNPNSPKARQQLTETEEKLQALCHHRRLPYEVVFSREDMASVISKYGE